MTAPCSKCGAKITRKDTTYTNIKRWVCFDCKEKNKKKHNDLATARWREFKAAIATSA